MNVKRWTCSVTNAFPVFWGRFVYSWYNESVLISIFLFSEFSQLLPSITESATILK